MLRALASRPLSAERLEGRAFVLAAAEMDEVDALDWRRRLEADPELARAVEEARAERAAGGGPPA